MRIIAVHCPLGTDDGKRDTDYGKIDTDDGKIDTDDGKIYTDDDKMDRPTDDGKIDRPTDDGKCNTDEDPTTFPRKTHTAAHCRRNNRITSLFARRGGQDLISAGWDAGLSCS